MSKKLNANEFEEQDGWIAKLRDRWFGDHEYEEEEEPYAPPPTNGTAPRPRRGGGGTLLQVHQHRGSQITKRAPRSLADAQKAAEDLKERRPVIVNLEGARPRPGSHLARARTAHRPHPSVARALLRDRLADPGRQHLRNRAASRRTRPAPAGARDRGAALQ